MHLFRLLRLPAGGASARRRLARIGVLLLACALGASLWAGAAGAQEPSASSAAQVSSASSVPSYVSSPLLLVDLPGLSATLSVLTDPGAELELADVAAPGRDAAFRPLTQGLNESFSRAAYWLRIDLAVPSALSGSTAYLRVMPADLDEIAFHTPDGRVQHAGAAHPFVERALPYPRPTGAIELVAPHTRVYVRLRVNGPMAPYLSLISAAAFPQAVQQENLLLGLFFGAMLIVLVMNLMNWLWLRSRLYRDYVVFLLMSGIVSFSAHGYAAAYFFPSAPGLAAAIETLALSWMTAFAVFFSLRLFRIDGRHRVLRRILRALAWIVLANGALAFTPWIGESFFFAIHCFALYGILALTGSARNLWRERSIGALFLFVIYLVFIFFHAVSLCVEFGLLPATPLTASSWEIGTVVHLFLLHLAIVFEMRSQQRSVAAKELQVRAAQSEAESEKQYRAELNRFLGMMGHELGTPLAVIDITVQSLELLPGAELPEVSDRHARIRKAVKRLDQLIRESLQRERIESNGWKVKVQTISVPDLIDAVVAAQGLDSLPVVLPERLRLPMRIAGQPGGALEVELAPDLPPCRGDVHLLQVVLGNLIENARKYADPGSTVTLAVALCRKALRFSLTSQGEEIDDEELMRLFEKYYRRETRSDVAGSGLGLHLVRHIVHLHGGSVSARSLPGRRTCFAFELPLPQGAGND